MLKRKGLIKKLILVLMVLLLFSVVFPNTSSYATNDADSFGGKLLKPLIDLIVAIGDIIMDFIHSMIYGNGYSVVRVDLDNNLAEIIVTVVVGLLVAVAVTAALVYGASVVLPQILSGIAAAVGTSVTAMGSAAVGTIIVTSIIAGAKAGVFAAVYVHSSEFGHEAVLTLYQITPEEIFSGQLEMLNVNFFSSASETEKESKSFYMKVRYNKIGSAEETEEENKKLNNKMKEFGYSGKNITFSDCIGEEGKEKTVTKWVNNEDGTSYTLKSTTIGYEYSDSAGGPDVYDLEISIKNELEPIAISRQIKAPIAKWYYIIRNLALVLMMPILIYIGIRMILTSVSTEKAKYKNMLVDWGVAICLLFVMQYIMIFSMNIVESITNMVNIGVGNLEHVVAVEDEDGKIEEALNKEGLWHDELKGENKESEGGIDNSKTILWDAKNIMGIIRTEAAIEKGGSYRYMGYALSFIVLVWYTLFFLYTYIKRIIYLAFLTVIAPLVAMTYPIDKINDGKAQAFDMWLKEYIFNLLIQPMHLILYTLLVSMAFDLASTNIVYTLVAIGFMMPAEKLLRKFFGFEKAQTPGVLGGAAGAALMMGGLNHIFRKPPGRKGDNDNTGNVKETKNDKINTFSDTSGIDDAHLLYGSQEPAESGGGSFNPLKLAGAESDNRPGPSIEKDSLPGVNTESLNYDKFSDEMDEYLKMANVFDEDEEISTGERSE